MQGIVEYLEHYCEEITPREFYRKIFPEGELDVKGEFNKGKYIGVALSIAQKKICRYSVTDDLDIIDELCGSDDFCIMSPISYAGKSRESKNARFLYALAFDLDGIRMRELEGWPGGMANLFYQFDGNGPSNYLPKPTMIVYSGGGLHLYYVFEKAIPLFSNIVGELDKYRCRLTWQLWTQGVSDLQDAVQYESVFQGFRMPGTVTKQGQRARAFLVDGGSKVSMEYMNRFVPEEYRTKDFAYKSNLTLAQAKKKYPEWYERRIEKGQPRGSWTASPAVYEWWKRQMREKTEDGHRYWSVMALATYAKKCGIPRDQLEKDALEMVSWLHERGKREDNPFTEDDVLAALEAYNDSYITYPIDTISARTGIRIEKNKRNGRKQQLHLRLARASRDILCEVKEKSNWREGNGRPKGSTKEHTKARSKIEQYRAAHPGATKAEVIRETGLSPKTVYKWWDSDKIDS